MKIPTGMLIAGTWRESSVYESINDKFTDDVLASIAVSDEHQVNEAMHAARDAAESGLSIETRVELLRRATDYLAEDAEELADLICGETGKILVDARGRYAEPSPCSGRVPKNRSGSVVT